MVVACMGEACMVVACIGVVGTPKALPTSAYTPQACIVRQYVLFVAEPTYTVIEAQSSVKSTRPQLTQLHWVWPEATQQWAL